MHRCVKLVSLLLLALWLPVTLHCHLEAAELWPEHGNHADTTCCAPKEDCTKDACSVLEGDALRNADTFTRAPLPVPYICLEQICFRPIEPMLHDDAKPEPESLRHTLNWVPTWHFARRAAPWSGAPSLTFA